MAYADLPVTTAEVLVSFVLQNLESNEIIDKELIRKGLQLLDDDHPVLVTLQEFYERYKEDPMTKELHEIYCNRFSDCDLDEQSQEQLLNMLWQEQLADGQNINWNSIVTVLLIVYALISEANCNWEQERINFYIHWTLKLFDEYCIDLLLENNGGWEELSSDGQRNTFETPWHKIASYSPYYSPTSNKRKVSSKRPTTASTGFHTPPPPRYRDPNLPKPETARALDFNQPMPAPRSPTNAPIAPKKMRTVKTVPTTPERRTLMDEFDVKSLHYSDEQSSGSLGHSGPRNVPPARNPNLPRPNREYFPESTTSSGNFPSFVDDRPPVCSSPKEGSDRQSPPKSPGFSFVDFSGSRSLSKSPHRPQHPASPTKLTQGGAGFSEPGGSDPMSFSDSLSQEFGTLQFEDGKPYQPPISPSRMQSPIRHPFSPSSKAEFSSPQHSVPSPQPQTPSPQFSPQPRSQTPSPQRSPSSPRRYQQQ